MTPDGSQVREVSESDQESPVETPPGVSDGSDHQPWQHKGRKSKTGKNFLFIGYEQKYLQKRKKKSYILLSENVYLIAVVFSKLYFPFKMS